MSETITEDIVRDHFKNDECSDKIIIERHGSSNPRIKKLLKNASKSGNGCGYPDLIITFEEHSNHVIVVECKADITKHKSKERDNYRDYAVDGVLLYSSYLSKEFNVLSIAISGEDVKNLKITHFLQLIENTKSEEVFGNKLLTIKNYMNKFTQDVEQSSYEDLLVYATKLNDELHSIKVKESQRSLLISGILIALEAEDFRTQYAGYEDPDRLAGRLVDEIKRQLEKALPTKVKAKNVAIAYSFIRTHPALTKDKDILKNLIKDIYNKIYRFIKSNNGKGNDILGQFYIEFLQYSNNDKALGIVLTPLHITQLFSDLAMVNKDSIVLDTCTGTGGFLISGMKKMLDDAKGDQEKEDHIKRHQIIGIEYQDDIFALACSNMYIHGDGRSNIKHGSCFDNEIIKEVKELKPTVGFLNPPYKTEKTDKHELEFILNNLSMLEKGGMCVAIVPMSCALSQSGEEHELKKQIMEQHTLEAVFSMPDELFVNSNVGTVTCIMVIKAGQPHPENYETYFGYCKDDGFYKRKHTGRGDYGKKWETIRKQWINSFYNKKEIPGFSVKKYITSDDEWCAEAYMDTDYSKIKEDDFIKTIKDFIVFSFYNNLINNASYKSISGEKYNLNTSEWKSFRYDELFNIKKGNRIVNENMLPGKTPCIRAISSNNGVFDYIDIEPNHSENTITINYGGSVAEAFYQPLPYFALDSENILYSKFKLNKYIAMFLITLIRKEKYRFNYGRMWHLKRMSDSIIKLPSKPDGSPDFEFMENYIKSLPYSSSL